MTIPVTRSRLVGREREVDVLGHVLDAVATGAPATVLVGGEAGIGKTRLIDELQRIVEEYGWRFACGVSSPMDGATLPYGPVVGALRGLEHQLHRGQSEELIGPAFHALGLPRGTEADRAEVPVNKPAPDSVAKTWLFEAVLRSLVNVAELSPLVMVMEDLHWADIATLGLIDFLTRNVPRVPLLMVCTYRTDEVMRQNALSRFVSELARNTNVTHIRLGALEEGDVASMVASMLGQRPQQSLVRSIHARSGGNPFFIEELVTSGQSSEISFVLVDAVMAKVNWLPNEARHLLKAASAFGGVVPNELLAETMGLHQSELAHGISELVASQLLFVNGHGDGYLFRHELLREVVYDALLPGERTDIHARIATAIDDHRSIVNGPGYADAELARHWWAAGEWSRAFDSAVVAADEAETVYAFDEALSHLEHALASLDKLSRSERKTPDRASLLERASDDAYFAGASQRATELARLVVEHLDPVKDPLRAGMAYARLARGEWALSNQQQAFKALEQAERLVPPEPPTAARARVLAEKARLLMLLSRDHDAQELCHRSLAVARAVGARSVEGHALNTLGVCRGNLGHYDESIALLDTAMEVAEEIGSAEDINRALGNLSGMLYSAGRLQEVVDVSERARLTGEAWGGIGFQGAATNSADALIDMGRWDEAEEVFASLGQIMGNCANHPALSLSLIAIRQGRGADAQACLNLLDRGTANLGDVQFRGLFHIRRAQLALSEGRPADAYGEVEQGLSLAAATDDIFYAPEMCALGVQALADALERARGAGRRRDEVKYRLLAAELTDRTLAMVERRETLGGSPPPRTGAFTLQCQAEQSRVHTPDPELWNQAAGSWERLCQPFELAYCRWREAECWLVRRTRSTRAGKALQEAWQISAELGAVPLRTEVETLAQRARIPLARKSEEASRFAQLASDLGLTPREVEVLAYLVEGRTDTQISEGLFISKKTASVHVSNLLRKLDAENRQHAGEIGRAAGLGTRGS